MANNLLLDECQKDILEMFEKGYSIKYIIKTIEKRVNTRIKVRNRLSGGMLYVYISEKYVTKIEVAQYVYCLLIRKCRLFDDCVTESEATNAVS